MSVKPGGCAQCSQLAQLRWQAQHLNGAAYTLHELHTHTTLLCPCWSDACN